MQTTLPSESAALAHLPADSSAPLTPDDSFLNTAPTPMSQVVTHFLQLNSKFTFYCAYKDKEPLFYTVSISPL